MMNVDLFWIMIEDALSESKSTGNGQDEILRDMLEKRSEEDMLEFDTLFNQFMDKAYLADLWDACDFITCGGGESNFLAFRAWLIAQGREVYNRAIDDPDTLSELDQITPELRLDIGFERFSYAASSAYRAKTGQNMPRNLSVIQELKGTQVSENRLPEKFPKLNAKLGSCD